MRSMRGLHQSRPKAITMCDSGLRSGEVADAAGVTCRRCVITSGVAAVALFSDPREIGPQASEVRIGLVDLAGVIVAVRAATIAAAGCLYWTRTRGT